jgi:hypothetical protein
MLRAADENNSRLIQKYLRRPKKKKKEKKRQMEEPRGVFDLLRNISFFFLFPFLLS